MTSRARVSGDTRDNGKFILALKVQRIAAAGQESNILTQVVT
jgi:hypothetical protein